MNNIDEEIKNINKVLNAQNEKINNIKLNKNEKNIKENGFSSPANQLSKKDTEKEIVYVESWDNILKEAEKQSDILNVFDDNEIKEKEEALKKYMKEFNELHKLDNVDISISVLAGLVSAIVDIILVGIPNKTPNGLSAGNLSNQVRKFFEKKFPEEEMNLLANSKKSKVPYDSQDNRNTSIHVEGLSAYYHRMLQIGHDPFLGLLFGVKDILNGTMTTIDKKGKIVVQVIEEYKDRQEKDIFAAIAKQFIHFASDITTSMGLPAPLMSLFNFLQFGKIGEYEQTIAEIVQSMYYEGYDFIHFCSLSIPVMISEVITRICYSIKKIKSGESIKNSIPISLNREKNPKLATMLFLSHTTATAINTGKIIITKNPMAINYPQWLMFFKCSYQQLKWILMEKPEAREKYISNKYDVYYYDVFNEVNKTFDNFFDGYVVVMK